MSSSLLELLDDGLETLELRGVLVLEELDDVLVLAGDVVLEDESVLIRSWM